MCGDIAQSYEPFIYSTKEVMSASNPEGDILVRRSLGTVSRSIAHPVFSIRTCTTSLKAVQYYFKNN